MSLMTDGFEARAAVRAGWPVRKLALRAEGEDDPGRITSPAERLAMMWELAAAAWGLSGRSFPRYRRGETPGHVIRPRS